jgi:hypothetical protein
VNQPFHAQYAPNSQMRLRRRVHLPHMGAPACRRAPDTEFGQGANITPLVIYLGCVHFFRAIRNDHSAQARGPCDGSPLPRDARATAHIIVYFSPINGSH